MSKSPNRVLVVVIGIIVIVVAVVAVLSSTRSVVILDRTTPAGAVQVYLKAILGGRNTEAARVFSPQSLCRVADLDRAYIADTSRVNLLGSTISGTTAEVRVRVEIPSGSPLGDFMTEDHTFRLISSHGIWYLSGVPWPLYDCGVLIK